VLVERVEKRNSAINQPGERLTLLVEVGPALESEVVVDTLAFIERPKRKLEHVGAGRMQQEG
jgi:hypothetical protein